MIKKRKNRFEAILQKLKKYFAMIDFIFKILIIVILLFLILEFFSLIAIKIYQKTSIPEVNLEIYPSKEFILEFFKEVRKAPEIEYYPYLGYRLSPNFHGKYVNLDNESVRETKPDCSYLSEKPLKIFVFGGSTLWGWGVRDKETIPSFLSKYLCENNIISKVTNFGENGYVSTQELIKLQLELKKGNYPNIVIFYDGHNDVYTAIQYNLSGITLDIQDRIRDFNSRNKLNLKGALFDSYFFRIIRRLLGADKIGAFESEISPELKKEIVSNYLTNVKIVKAFEKSFNFKSFFYWQPSVFQKAPLSKAEQSINNSKKILGETYIEITNMLETSEDVKDLSEIFNNLNRSIFMDHVHVAEGGNRIIAEQIGKDIVKYLKTKK